MMDVTSSMVSLGNTNSSVSNSGNSEMLQQCDEVDFVAVAAHNNNNNNIFKSHIMNNNQSGNNSNAVESTTNISNSNSKIFANSKTSTNEHLRYQQQPRQQEQQQNKDTSKSKKKSASSSEEPKKKNSAKERLSLFSTLGRRISQKTLGQKDKNADASSTQSDKTIATESSATTPTTAVATTNPTDPATPPRPRTFVKGSSIARLLGHTHKKFEKYQQTNEKDKTPVDGKFHTYGGRRRTNGPYLDRFKRYSKDDGDVNSTNTSNDNSNNNDEDANTSMDFTDVLDLEADTADELQRDSSGLDRFCDHSTVAAGDDEAAAELGSKTMRTLSRSLGRLWGKRLHSVNISTPDPEYKVSYLGNVLTGWAKGELKSCVCTYNRLIKQILYLSFCFLVSKCDLLQEIGSWLPFI